MSSLAGDLVMPGRRLIRAYRVLAVTWEPVLGALLAAGLILVTRLPLRTRYLLNWDAVQFALGLSHFDVIHHQPHPPGYPGYELAGRLLLPLGGGANQALVTLSIGGEAAAAVIGFWFARSLFGRAAGWLSALALVASPLYWYYGEAADTYALEPPLVLGVSWLCWRAWQGQGRSAVLAAGLLGLGGSLRPSTEVLLSPLLLVTLLRLRSVPTVLAAIGVGALLTAAWAVPLAALSGGPVSLLHASIQLGDSVTSGSAVWRAGLAGLQSNLGAVVLGLVWFVGVFLIPLGAGLLAAPRLDPKLARMPPGWVGFVGVWAAPALLTFLFVHIGQVVYVQVFAPALLLLVGPALAATSGVLGRPQLLAPLAAACLAANVALFFLPTSNSLAAQLARHDREVKALNAEVSNFDPSRAALVLDGYATGNYREAQVYLPAYQRVAVARDRRGSVGEVFGDVYDPAGFLRAGPLTFAPAVDTFIFPDQSVVTSLVADPRHFEVRRLEGGQSIRIWRGPPPRLYGGLIWLGSPFDGEESLRP